MPESRSALMAHYPVGRYPSDCEPGVRLREIVGRDLVQVAAWQDSEEDVHRRTADVLGITPSDRPGRWNGDDDIEVMTVAPGRLWCLAPAGDERLVSLTAAIDTQVGSVTALGHSHVRVRLEGGSVRRLLAQEIAIDLAPTAFRAGHIARTPMHHVPVLLQAIEVAEDAVYDLYLPHTYAVSIWTYLLDLARPFGYEIAEAASPAGLLAER